MSTWWNGLSKAQQRAYLAAHPNSKYAMSKDVSDRNKAKKKALQSKSKLISLKRSTAKGAKLKTKLRLHHASIKRQIARLG